MITVKQELERAEERIELVEYRSAERASEIEEALDSYVTRVRQVYYKESLSNWKAWLLRATTSQRRILTERSSDNWDVEKDIDAWLNRSIHKLGTWCKTNQINFHSQGKILELHHFDCVRRDCDFLRNAEWFEACAARKLNILNWYRYWANHPSFHSKDGVRSKIYSWEPS